MNNVPKTTTKTKGKGKSSTVQQSTARFSSQPPLPSTKPGTSELSRFAERVANRKPSTNRTANGKSGVDNQSSRTPGKGAGTGGQLVRKGPQGGRDACASNDLGGRRGTNGHRGSLLDGPRLKGAGAHLLHLSPHDYSKASGALFARGSHKRFCEHLGMSVPIAAGAGSVPYIMSTTNQGGNMKTMIAGIQYLYGVQLSSGSFAGTRLFVFPITPKSSNNTAVFLGTEMYELATLKRMSLHYIASCAATLESSLVAYFVPDPDWVPNQNGTGSSVLAEAYETLNFCENQVWESADWEISLPKERQIYTTFDTNDPDETCLGFIVIMQSAASAQASSPGHYLLKQEWEFENRQLTLPTTSVSQYGTISFAWAASTFGIDDSVTLAPGTNGITVTETFDQVAITNGQVLLLCLTVTGSAGTSLVVDALGFDEEQGLLLGVPGTLVWAVQWYNTSSASVYGFFASRSAALGMLQSSNSGTAYDRGVFRWNAAYTATGSLDLAGYSWIL